MMIEKMMEMGVWYVPGKSHYHFTMRDGVNRKTREALLFPQFWSYGGHLILDAQVETVHFR